MATRALPMAIRLVAMSRMKGGFLSVAGMAKTIGLVESRESVPPKGATIEDRPITFTKWIEANPASAHISPYVPTRPM